MRIKLSFTKDGVPIQDQGEVNNFPPTLWQWRVGSRHFLWEVRGGTHAGSNEWKKKCLVLVHLHNYNTPTQKTFKKKSLLRLNISFSLSHTLGSVQGSTKVLCIKSLVSFFSLFCLQWPMCEDEFWKDNPPVLPRLALYTSHPLCYLFFSHLLFLYLTKLSWLVPKKWIFFVLFIIIFGK